MSKIVKHFYVHVPYCKHLCNYCDFYKEKLSFGENFSSFERLLQESLLANHDLMVAHGFTFGPLHSFYLGGGTPSLWGKSGANFLQALWGRGLEREADCEITLEVDPDSWRQDQLFAWKDAGVNRWSVGLQSQSDHYLEILDRKHRWHDAQALLKWLSDRTENFSVDFMLGVPRSNQHRRNIIDELENVLAYGPKHVSLYLMEVRKHYVHYDELPPDDYAAEEYLSVVDYLRAQGFNHYEVSNFAKPGFESVHNRAYWNHCSVAAIGPSASGFLHMGEKGLRYKWKAHAPSFQVEELERDELRLEQFFVRTRTSEGVNYKDFFFGENLDTFTLLMTEWINRGWVYQGECMSLTAKGMLNQDTLFDEMFQKGII